ncbi:MAG: MFS transporter [Gammaproteobacteria bacterium]|nr:MFS transporter [Gammaproteobacteria bacterium]MDH5240113.1 MFS transporter [Gammaproteobacteria bacterium]MDH5260471.1 MFS transporter [Gammaproteobacteria bacterium]MDH5582935.1 MFS transporter [Gammaproteobacteria bacterium]
MTTAKDGIIARLAKKLSEVEANELKATLVATLFVFILMASYYILRPVRDAMASDWTDSEVSFLWNINFFVSAGIVAVYGFAVSRVRLRSIVPAMYGFFATTFVAFYFGISLFEDRVLVDKAFYLWVSVYALFNVSVFWTFMADTFNAGQAKRLFGIIGAGASAGALVGPAIPTLFAGVLGNDTLMLIASVSLLMVIPLVFYTYHLKATELGNAELQADTSKAVVGGNWWQGFQAFFTNPFLLGIGVFILLYVFIGSFIYFEQKNLLEEFSREERTQILGSIDWLVNVVTFGMAFFLTGRIVGRIGMATALAMMPVLVAGGLLILAFAPILTVLLALQVFRRGGNYGLTRPAREMLYTRVTREERFKAKPVIDIVVYRGGDAISGTLFAFLTDGIGLGLAAVAVVGAAISAAWGAVGVWLGKRFDSVKETRTKDE